jgi:hypothetical protein
VLQADSDTDNLYLLFSCCQTTPKCPGRAAPILGTTVRTVRWANHSATTAEGSKRMFVITYCGTPSGVGLMFSKALGWDRIRIGHRSLARLPPATGTWHDERVCRLHRRRIA